MKKHGLLIMAFVIPCLCYAQSQHYKYKYDASGNRISRTIIINSSKKSELKSTDIKTYNDIFVGKQIKIVYCEGDSYMRIVGGDNFPTASYFLYDAMGGMVGKGDINTSETTIDISDLISGVYVLKISFGKESITWKLVKK